MKDSINNVMVEMDGETVCFFTHLDAEQIDLFLHIQGKQVDDFYEVKDEELQFYIYEPIHVTEKEHSFIVNKLLQYEYQKLKK